MNIYNYHQKTLEFVGQSQADPDPLDVGKWLIPAHSTPVQPPSYIEGKIRLFINDEWVYQDIKNKDPVVEPIIEPEYLPPISDDQPATGVQLQGEDGIPLTDDEIKINDIKSSLDVIDLMSIRPLRAIISGTQTQGDIDKLASLDEQSCVLRLELASIQIK